MSTILNALKKLEAESKAPAPEAEQPSVWRRKAARYPGGTRFTGTVRVVAFLAAAAAMALGGWMWWRGDDGRAGSGQVQKPAVTQAPPTAPAPAPAIGTPEQTAPIAPAAKEAAGTLPNSVNSLKKAPIKEPSSLPQAVPGPPKPETVAADRSSPPLPVGEPEQPTPAESPDRPQVTIQAIAWSIDPANRIAVVDGNVVHEGDTLGRLRVARIGKNHVTLRQGDRTWTVEFGKR